MKLSELYSEYLANWISDGSLITRDKISLLGIKPLYDRYLTNGWITKVWMVVQMPVHYDTNITHAVRNEMAVMHPDVRTVVHMYGKPVNVNINGESFLRQMRNASARYERYEEVFESLSEDQKMTGVVERDRSGRRFAIDKRTLQDIKDTFDSYAYVYGSTAKGVGFAETYYFIQASAKTKRGLYKYKKSLADLLRGEGIALKEVRGNIGTYIDNFCPAAFIKNAGKFRSMLLSQENAALMLPNKTRGLVNESGILIGLDWMTKLPFFASFFDSGAAQVNLINGKTGCGKTYLAFMIAVSLCGFGVHCSAIDIKGGEWDKVSPFVDVLEVKMGGRNARFVNTLRLDGIKCSRENCAELYDNAVQGTVDVFTIIVNLQENEGNLVDLVSILETAVVKLFSSHDVVRDNPDTFYRTAGLKYSDVLEIVSNLESTHSYSEQQCMLCRLVRTRSAPFFMSEGRHSDSLKNEITVAEILETPMVVYNMNKNNAETLDSLDNLKIYMSQFLDGEKHFLRKQEKKHTAVFYEELQRCGSLRTLIRSISAKVTGSRSNNLTVFLLLNAVAALDSSAFAAIRSNITTKIIGLVTKNDAEKLAAEYDCEDIKDYIDAIRNCRTGHYNNCFAVSYDNGVKRDRAIIKSVVPDKMCRAFATRDRISRVE